MRLARALAWLRLRLLVNTMRGGRGRDTFEETSRIASLLAPLALALVLAPTAAACGALGVGGGFALAERGTIGFGAGLPAAAVRVGLFVLLAVAAFAPLMRSVHGGRHGIERLRLLPVGRSALHRGEVSAGLTDPWIAVPLPFLAGLPIGLALGGRPGAAVWAALAGLAFTTLLLALNAASAFACSLLFRDRRRRELVTVVVVGLLSLSGLAGALVSDDGSVTFEVGADAADPGGARRPGTRERLTLDQRLDRALPVWARAVPSELYARSIAGAVGSSGKAAAPGSIAAVGAWAAAAWLLSRRLYDRVLDEPGGGNTRAVSRVRVVPSPRFAGLGPAASAVAWSQLRRVVRSSQGRLALFMSAIAVVVLDLVVVLKIESLARLGELAGPALAFAGMAVIVLGWQSLLCNLFATDGPGLQLELLAPIRPAELVRGKLAACGALVAAGSLVSFAVALVLLPGGHPAWWVALWPAALAGFALTAPAAAIASAWFPKTADLNVIGRGGKPHFVASIVGLVVPAATFGVAAALGLLASTLGLPPWLGLVMVALWAAVAVVAGAGLAGLAARAVARRRETLLLVAVGR